MKSRVLSMIDDDYLVSLTQRLIRIKTPNPPADYTRIQAEMRSLMEGAGLTVRVIEGLVGKPNVVGLWRGSDPSAPTLLLDGHMDVVPPGDGWHGDPWAAEIRDGALWGRGAVDMKQGLATMVVVAEALRKAGFEPKGNLMLSATNDDETAGKFGLKYVVEKGLSEVGWPRPDFHLLLEPTNWSVNVAYKGRVWVEVSVGGKSAHGGAPDRGTNAILKLMEITRRILAIERNTHPLMPGDTINLGTISGGKQTNVVPDKAQATFDYRFVAPRTAADAIHRLREAVSSLERDDPEFTLSGFRVFEERDPVEVDPNCHPVALLSKTKKEVSGRPAPLSGALSAGNAYWSLSNGIPAVMAGPGNPDLMHTDDEHIHIQDLLEGARIVAAFVVRYLG